MAKYRYRALSDTGKVITGTMEDSSPAAVREKLTSNGFKPISVSKSLIDANLSGRKTRKYSTGASATTKYARDKLIEEQKKKQQRGLNKQIDIDLSFLKRATKTDLFSFTQSFYLLKRAGFTNIRALSTLLENTENPAMRDIVQDILVGVENGEYIYSTMEYYDNFFPDIYIATIKIGELSGSLTESLEQAMIYLEDNDRTGKAIRKALVGPLLQTVLLLIGTVIGVLVGVPILEDLYGSMGLTSQIPPATLAMSHFVKAMIANWYIIVVVIVGLVVAFISWKSSVRGKYQWDLFKIKMPIFGGLILRLSLQKFFKAIQLNLKNNAKLQDALEISKSTVRSYVLLSTIESAVENLTQGDSWVEPFERLPNMPPMVLEMLRIGMETDIVEMIDKIVEYMQSDIDIQIERIIKTLPNVSMSIMGIVMIIFVIVILVPIMEVYMGSFLFDAYLN
ncbi:MAG: type II secretion system F family protein [Clostridia bacterium]|nr:type II secretion system F family protein [Clostridia bacterium]